MWLKPPFLLLLLLGFSGTILADEDPDWEVPNILTKRFASGAVAGPEFGYLTALRFFNDLLEVIKTQDEAKIGEFFDEKFLLNGCEQTYAKGIVVRKLSHLVPNTDFNFIMLSAESIYGTDQIQMKVKGTAFGYQSLMLNLVMSKSKKQLIRAMRIECKKGGVEHHFRGVVGKSIDTDSDLGYGPHIDGEKIVVDFMARMMMALNHNRDSIRGFFQDNFMFRGCLKFYNNNDMITNLLERPAGTAFEFYIHDLIDYGNVVTYHITGTGFGPKAISAQLVFNRFSGKLESGRQPHCHPVNRRRLREVEEFLSGETSAAHRGFVGTQGFIAQEDTAQEQLKAFLTKLETAVRAKDAPAITNLMKPDFKFVGCQGTYDRQGSVDLFLQLPSGVDVDYTIQSVQDLGDTIKAVVIAEGMKKSIHVEFEFTLNKKDQQLESASMKCPSHRFHGVRRFGSQEASPQDQLKAFLTKLEAAVRAKDAPAITNLMKPDFKFVGCQGTYDRQGSVDLFLQLPSGVDVSYTIESVQDLRDTIKAVVIAEGMKKSIHVEFEFTLNKKDQQLESASMKCPPKRRFHGSLDVSAQDQLKAFLTKLETAVRAKDAPAITNLMKPDFKFVGCQGTYDRQGSVDLFLQIPSGADVDYTIQSVQDLGDTIKAVVIAEGMKKSIHVEFEFTLNKKDQQLESASMKCPPKRRFFGVRRFGFQEVSPQDQLKAFLTKLETAVRAKDASAITNLMKPDFKFIGCQGTYDRQGSVDLFLQIPSGADVDYTIQSVQDQGDILKAVVIAEGMKKSIHVEFEFTLNKKDQQLESASMKCPPKRRFHGSLDVSAQNQLKAFLTKLETAVRAKDAPAITNLMKPDFKFVGCQGTYDRKGAVELFRAIPSGVDVSYNIESVEDLGETLKAVVIAEGMKKSIHVEFEFTLNKKDQQLESASMKCPPKRRFFGEMPQVENPRTTNFFMAQKENQRTIVFNFLTKFVAALEGHDPYVFLKFFEDNFKFKGCKQEYNITQMVAAINQVPAGNKFDIELGPIIYDLGKSLRFTIKLSGFAPEINEAEFVLNKSSLKLESGNRKNCPKRAFGRMDQDGANTIVYRFLSEMTSSINTRNAIMIGTLFDGGFEFKGCKGTYGKREVVGILSQLPKNSKFSFDLKSAYFISDSNIQYTVEVSGMGASTIEAQFVLDSRIDVLLSGSIPNCQKRHFVGVTQFKIDGVHGLAVKHSGLQRALDPNEDIVHEFLARLTKAVVLKDYAQIQGLFQDAFVFKGCKGQYTKEQVVDILCRLPPNTKFTIDLLSVQDLGTTIKYTVSAVGFGGSGIQAEFVLNKEGKQLESGSIPLCQTGTPGDSNEIAEKFMANMKEVANSRDGGRLAAVFDDGFQFKKCDGTFEDKAASIEKILSGTKFITLEFKLISSEFNEKNQIEATVDVIAAPFKRNRTHFVFDPSRNVLISGYDDDCKKKMNKEEIWN